MVSLEEVYAARKVIGKYLKPTPLMYSRTLSRELESDVCKA